MTMTELCAELNNYFERGEESGEFEIIDGKLNVDFLLNNQYFRISGSTFNDGVHKFSDDEKLTDEKFSGVILLMAIPPAVISLADDINKWLDDNKAALNSPYSSESFGGYSYSLATDTGGGAVSSGVSWQAHFRSYLNKWRKV